MLDLKRILYIEPDDDKRDIVSLHVENIDQEFDVTACLNLKQATKLIKISKNWNCLLLSSMNTQSSELIEFSKLILSDTFDSSCDIICFGDSSEENECLRLLKEKHSKTHWVKDNLEFEELKISINNIFSSSAYTSDLYHKVKIIHFYKYNKILCDLYLRLSKDKFIKILYANDIYSSFFIDKYRIKGLDYFYISKDDYENFVKDLGENKFLTVESAKNVAPEKIIENLSSAHKYVQQVIKTTGLTDEVVNIASECIELMIKESQNKKTIFALANKMKNEHDFLFEHSMMTSYFSSILCKYLKWSLKTSIEKLAYAAYFHDIALDSPELAKVLDLDELAQGDYCPEEIKSYESHPLVAAQLVQEAKTFPADIDHIIVSHHENPKGEGFPYKKNSLEVSQLIAVFIISHRFVLEIVKVSFKKIKYPQIIKEMNDVFLKGNYKEPMKALAAYVDQLK